MFKRNVHFLYDHAKVFDFWNSDVDQMNNFSNKPKLMCCLMYVIMYKIIRKKQSRGNPVGFFFFILIYLAVEPHKFYEIFIFV